MTSRVQNKPKLYKLQEDFSVSKEKQEFYLPWHRNGDARSCCDIPPPSVQQTSFFKRRRRTGCSWVKQSQIPVFREVQTWTVFEKQRGQPITKPISFPPWKSGVVLILCTLSSNWNRFWKNSQSSTSFTRISLQLIPSMPVVQLQLEVLRSALAPVAPELEKVTPCRHWWRENTATTTRTDRWNHPLCWQKGERLRSSRSRSSVSRWLRSGLRHRASSWSRKLRQELLRVQEFDSRLFSPPRSHSSQPCERCSGHMA